MRCKQTTCKLIAIKGQTKCTMHRQQQRDYMMKRRHIPGYCKICGVIKEEKHIRCPDCGWRLKTNKHEEKTNRKNRLRLLQ